MVMEPSSETAERENEVYKARNSGTDNCKVTRGRKKETHSNMRGTQFGIKIIDGDIKTL